MKLLMQIEKKYLLKMVNHTMNEFNKQISKVQSIIDNIQQNPVSHSY